MLLNPGTRLGPYEVLSAIGAGGMGEVYKARDAKLGRDVALKILPDTFAQDADRLMRFEREAKTLASLNHPNIAQIYGMEGSALVMELVEGEDLSARIARGPMAVSDALAFGRQIADALEAAHEAGVVHRDLKPANIKIKPDGSVKVLDFGLAKAVEGDGSRLREQDPSPYSRTMTSPAMTAMGMILGTAAYMSPEQARGRPVDRRADLWAFGVVLVEMLTGRPLFPGETVTDVLASVVTREPDWTSLPADTPASIRRLLRRCLEKDPKRRLRDAADARLEIDEAQGGTAEGGSGVAAPSGRPASWRRWAWSGLVVAALVAGVAIGTWAMRRGGPAETSLRILNLTLPSASAPTVTISPDGRWIAVVSDRKVVVKGIEEFAWREVPGTAGAAPPLAWSPDSRRIAFPADSALKIADLVGSRPQTICDRCVQPNSLRGASWNQNGVILLGGSPEDAKLAGGLLKISERGGAMERVTSLDTARGENSHRYPTFLPDGRHFIFTVRRDNGEHEIRVGDLAGGPTRLLVSGFAKTAYAAGHLLFVRDETLLALPFDPATATATGDPIKLVEKVSESVGTALSSFAVANDGTLVFGRAPDTRGYQFLDRNGRKLVDVTTRQADAAGRLSPDGRRAAMAEIDPEKASTNIYVIDVATGARTQLTSDPSWEQNPVWSPEGRRVAYLARPGGRQDVYIQDAAGGNERRVTEASIAGVIQINDWSSDGKYLLLTASTTAGDELVRLSVSDGRLEPWVASKAAEGGARFSPDGRWVAYLSAETGSTEVHIRSFPDGAVSHRVTTTGGDAPLWSRDGKELYYRDRDGWVVAVGVRVTGTAIETGAPQRLFKPNLANLWGAGYQHDVDAAGRFFVYRVGDDTGSFANTLTVMLNWPRALKR
jgi:Tol biopolymer transport system component/tRNA A-37 threonylcarbamoyl transferase component Bud32